MTLSLLGIASRDPIPSLRMSGQQVPGGVVHKLPADLRPLALPVRLRG